MSEPPRDKLNRLQELISFFRAPDDIAPIDRHVFARKLGEIIRRGTASIQERYPAGRRHRRNKKSKQKR